MHEKNLKTLNSVVDLEDWLVLDLSEYHQREEYAK